MLIFIKNWLIRLQLRYDPFVRIAFTGFSEVVISNQSAADTLIGYYDLKPSIINENGLSSFSVINRVLQATVIRVLWVGKDLWTKRLDIALTIMNSIDTKGVEVEFHVVGIDSNVAASLNSNVTFVNHGILGRNELELLFKSCHINLFTSLSEGTPAVVLEGIHHGLWTICFDVCGQGDIIKSSFGDKIVPTAYEPALLNFKESVEERIKLINSSEGLLVDFSGLDSYLWSIKVKDFVEIIRNKCN